MKRGIESSDEDATPLSAHRPSHVRAPDETTAALPRVRVAPHATTGATPTKSDTERSLPSLTSFTSVTSPTTITSANDARAQSSTNSIRLLAGVMLGWCTAGIPMIAFVPGADRDKLFSTLGLAWVAACFAWIFVRSAKSDGFPPEDRVRVAVVLAAGANFLILGVGVCSTFAAISLLCILLYAFSAPPAHAAAAYGVVALGHATLGVLAATRVVSSTGMLDPAPREPLSIVLSVTWIELVYATALGLGSLVKRQVDGLMAQLEGSVRAAAQRDALLLEARAELDRAARLGGPGRFTGHDLGSFSLRDVIGRGGMGEVYAAVRRDDGSDAAVKLLRLDAITDAELGQRFEREARIVERLKSPHVVAVLEVGGPDALLPYIAMERLRGDDLAAVLRSRGTLPTSEVLMLVREVAAGLECAHAAGVVHRDLKPNNLFHAEIATNRRTWKVLDFGVSKLLSSDDATLTANQLVGTPQYMAPEQAQGARNVDHRADVHALAAIAYRALTGRAPFARSEMTQVLLAVAREVPEDPRRFLELPEDVALALRIGLAKAPADRFPSAKELGVALADASHERLSPEWRERARKLVALEPWGTRARRDSSIPPPHA